jgi:hypothetical protein
MRIPQGYAHARLSPCTSSESRSLNPAEWKYAAPLIYSKHTLQNLTQGEAF